MMKAIQIERFGRPSDVLQVADVPDVGAPAAGEVLIAVEASPINQYDLLMIAGGYGYRPRLPAIMGTEGVGRVLAVGSGVKHLKEGDRALIPFLHPAWAERVKTDAPWLRPLPSGDVNQFAMMGVNPPTAYLLLTDIVKLPSGSWVIQNGANSGVGRAVIAIAKLLGLKTINIVRRQQAVDETKALGGDVVLVDEPELAKRVAAETGNAPIMLALDGVGGTSTMNLMSTLFEGALLVSYGGMSRQPMAVQPGSLIFKKQTLRGFWLLDWYRSAEPEAIKVLFDHLVPIIAAGKISTPVVAVYGFDQFREAISKAAQSRGKILFTPKDVTDYGSSNSVDSTQLYSAVLCFHREGAKPQIKPAATQVIQRRGLFRGQLRVSRSVAVEQRTDPGLWGVTICRKRYIDGKLVESIAEIDAVVIDRPCNAI